MYSDGVEMVVFSQIKVTVGRVGEEKIELMSSSGCRINNNI